jgi:hypothetical protein
VVVALKSRTIPGRGRGQSLAALRWLQAQGAQIYFKYCSTFDSTAEGNIGPVTDALMEALGTDFTIATPAFPDNKRTVFKGYLFVGDVLLNESGMQNHPLTPMTDPNLVRVLQAQTPAGGPDRPRVVAQGEAAIRARIASSRPKAWAWPSSTPFPTTTCCAWARPWPACRWSPPARAWPSACRATSARALQPGRRPAAAPGLQAVVSGSCSVATNQQVAHFIARPARPGARPAAHRRRRDVAAEALAWAAPHRPAARCWSIPPPSPRPSRPSRAAGRGKAGALVEQTIAAIARGLVSAACASSWWPAARPPAPACRPWASRKCALARRSTPACPGAMPWPRRGRAAHHAQVGQLRQHRLLHQGLCTIAGMTSTPAFMDEAQARDEICRVGRSLFERGYVHATAGNISVRLADGYLITPTDACLGTLQPERLARLDAQGQQVAGDRASKTIALHRRSTRPQHRPPPARCVIHTHSTHLVACSLRPTPLQTHWRERCCPHHALLRHEGGPRAAHPLPPPRRAQRRRWWRRPSPAMPPRAALCAP